MEKTWNETLANEIIKFCIEYEVFEKTKSEEELKKIVHHHLNDEAFIENIINTFISTARTRNDMDVEKLKMILIELEKIRLELEYKDYNKVR